jgi:hypothetical protein
MRKIIAAVLLLLGVSSVRAVRVEIPESLPAHVIGDTVNVPILICHQEGLGVISADIALSWLPGELVGTSYTRTGNAVPPSGWSALANPIGCTLLVAMAGFDPLVAGDTLVTLRVVTNVDIIYLWIARCRLNEGQVACTTDNGSVAIAERLDVRGKAPEIRIWPNPSSGLTEIDYALGQGSHVQVSVLDVSGREVARLADGYQPAGPHRLRWPVQDLAPGLYLVRLATPQSCRIEKMIRL